MCVSQSVFVAGDNELHFEYVEVDGNINIRSVESIPPLNINGLRRLAKLLLAFAELQENAVQSHAMQRRPKP